MQGKPLQMVQLTLEHQNVNVQSWSSIIRPKCVALSGLRKRQSFLSNLSSTSSDSRVFEQVPNVETIIGQFILPSRVPWPQWNQKLKVQLMYMQTSILISRSAIVMRTAISFHCHFKRPRHFSNTRKTKTEALHTWVMSLHSSFYHHHYSSPPHRHADGNISDLVSSPLYDYFFISPESFD